MNSLRLFVFLSRDGRREGMGDGGKVGGGGGSTLCPVSMGKFKQKGNKNLRISPEP